MMNANAQVRLAEGLNSLIFSHHKRGILSESGKDHEHNKNQDLVQS